MICGIDEAGRGSLCGSLFVCGVACDDHMADFLKNSGIKDSKMLSRNTRTQLSSIIQNSSNIFFIIVEKNVQEIDTKGLGKCLKESIIEIIQKLQHLVKDFYIDGNTIFNIQPEASINLKSIIQGDSKIPQISAASILAKHAKDKEMEKLNQIYPAYNLINNSGYATKEHLDKIAILGQTPHHRKSFVIKSQQKNLKLF